MTGSGHLIQQSGIEYPDSYGMVQGHVVECPAGVPAPIYAFTFDTPVYVEGDVSTESTTNRYAELTMSLGREATADAPGRLGHEIVLHNNFADCPPELENTIIVGVGAPPPWSEVQTWPERNVDLFSDLYQAVIDATPITLEEGFFPPPEGDTSVCQSGGETDDGVRWNLQVGDVDFDQF